MHISVNLDKQIRNSEESPSLLSKLINYNQYLRITRGLNMPSISLSFD